MRHLIERPDRLCEPHSTNLLDMFVLTYPSANADGVGAGVETETSVSKDEMEHFRKELYNNQPVILTILFNKLSFV